MLAFSHYGGDNFLNNETFIVSGVVFHPGLESYVVDNDRPFPEITEHPGFPLPRVWRRGRIRW